MLNVLRTDLVLLNILLIHYFYHFIKVVTRKVGHIVKVNLILPHTLSLAPFHHYRSGAHPSLGCLFAFSTLFLHPQVCRTLSSSNSICQQQMREKWQRPVHFSPGLNGLKSLLPLTVYDFKEMPFNPTLEKIVTPSSLLRSTMFKQKGKNES